ncbi:MAG: methyltransferase domain-containing protein [Bacteroidales bacterium]|nr:MAG: methyltransferase domain-containing protein [Bacteroidales bacterium]
MAEQELKWDAKLYQENSAFQFELALMAIERLQPGAGDKILDIGCGNAISTIELAKHVPEGEVVAIEVSSEMYEQAIENIRERDIKNITVIKDDAFNINYIDEFDGVFSNSAIHWIYDLESMYNKIYKALKPDGKIMIQTALKNNNPLIDTAYKLLYEPEFNESFKTLSLPWRFLDEGETKSILQDNKFDNIVVEPYLYKIEFDNLKKLIDFFKSAALIPFFSVMPEEQYGWVIDKFLKIYFDLSKSDHLSVEMNRVFVRAEKRFKIND